MGKIKIKLLFIIIVNGNQFGIIIQFFESIINYEFQFSI